MTLIFINFRMIILSKGYYLFKIIALGTIGSFNLGTLFFICGEIFFHYLVIKAFLVSLSALSLHVLCSGNILQLYLMTFLIGFCFSYHIFYFSTLFFKNVVILGIRFFSLLLKFFCFLKVSFCFRVCIV